MVQLGQIGDYSGLMAQSQANRYPRPHKETDVTLLTLPQALDAIYGDEDWRNPIRPYSVSGVSDTPFAAYDKLKPEYKPIVRRLIGRTPSRDVDDVD